MTSRRIGVNSSISSIEFEAKRGGKIFTWTVEGKKRVVVL